MEYLQFKIKEKRLRNRNINLKNVSHKKKIPQPSMGIKILAL